MGSVKVVGKYCYSKLLIRNAFIFISFLLSTSTLFCQKKDFKIFNAFSATRADSINLRMDGFENLLLIYERYLLSYENPKVMEGGEKIIDDLKFTEAAERAKKNPEALICLDIEYWPMRTEAEKLSSTPKYEKAVEYFRKLLPGRSVELYNRPIQTDGIIYPSFYTQWTNPQEWSRRVILKVEKFRQKFPDVKIYAFIWPQFSPRKGWKPSYNPIPADYWRFQLETLYQYADGVVIWGLLNKNNKPLFFDRSMPWFKETIEFMKAHNLYDR